MKSFVSLVYGSARFSCAVTNNINQIFVGAFDVPTKLVDGDKNVALCLPADFGKWGNYPTHQESWLSLPFIVACHSRHEDEAGLVVRQAAFDVIPPEQWPALAAKAVEFVAEFRQRLEKGGEEPRKLYKPLTRALQDCVLYLITRSLPEDQDVFLAGSSVAELVVKANAGRSGELSQSEGLLLADQADAIVSNLVCQAGGLKACQAALARLEADNRKGRVIVLPQDMPLEQAVRLVSFDLVIGTPDEHDMDVVSVVEDQGAPTLFQFRDILSQQRLDIIAVPVDLGPNDQLTGGHPAFQSVAEMLLANSRAITVGGGELFMRLYFELDPHDLSNKYLEVAKDMMSNAANPKSWAVRRNSGDVPQIKKAIPLYRVVCDLLPRAFWMRKYCEFTGNLEIRKLAEEAGLGLEYEAVRLMLDTQVAEQETLEQVAAKVEAYLEKL